MEIQIADRVYIDPSLFGQYCQEVLHPLLGRIANNINLVTGSRSNCACHIWKAIKAHPDCVKWKDGHNLIRLAVNGDYWCQWVYQFAHEYLHHTIGGTLRGDFQGQLWFEETLAELSSIYQLGMFHAMCLTSQSRVLRDYAPSVRDYRDALLSSNPDLKLQLRANGGVRQWLPLLSEPRYHRAHYNAVACRILPLFLDNPHLWRMVCHIGDSRRYESLDTLFAHLLRNADNLYRQSLQNLIRMLS